MNSILDEISLFGISHGLITAGLMGFVWWFVPAAEVVPAVGLICSVFYYQRERKARLRDGVKKFRDWYLDSQMDAVTPALVAVVFSVARFW